MHVIHKLARSRLHQMHANRIYSVSHSISNPPLAPSPPSFWLLFNIAKVEKKKPTLKHFIRLWTQNATSSGLYFLLLGFFLFLFFFLPVAINEIRGSLLCNQYLRVECVRRRQAAKVARKTSRKLMHTYFPAGKRKH